MGSHLQSLVEEIHWREHLPIHNVSVDHDHRTGCLLGCVSMNLRFRIGEKHSDGTYVIGDSADAHPDPREYLYGTVCFRTVGDLVNGDGVNLDLIVHELAHLQDREKGNKQSGHGTTWWELYLPMLKGINPESEKSWRDYGFPGRKHSAFP